MKKILILLLFSFKALAITNNQIAHVYHNLIRANNLPHPPMLVILKLSPNDKYYDNASADKYEISIDLAFISHIANEDEAAKVLSHELGHVYLHHNGSSIKNEYDADKQGAYYMVRAGYNVCRGAQEFIKRKAGHSYDHPSDLARYRALGCH